MDPNAVAAPVTAAPPPPPGGEAPPQGLPQPATQPQPQAGNQMLAAVHIQTAMQMLKSALGLSDLNTKEGKALLEVMKKMVTTFGMQSEAQSLVPAQIMELARSAQQSGAAPLQSQ